MLNRKQIEKNAVDFLIKNNFPIISTSGSVELPEDKQDPEEFLKEHNLAMVSFKSIYLDQPEHPKHELDPGIYIVYVDFNTGEVHMPKHM